MPPFLTSDFARSIYADLVRHALVGLSGVLVAHGLLASGSANDFIGAGFFLLVTWGWQLWENLQQAAAKAASQQPPTPTVVK